MNTPSLAEVLRSAIQSEIGEMHMCIPARVRTYDHDKQTVEVQPVIRRGRKTEDGSRASKLLPIIHGVPVLFPGANSYRVTFPIVEGDMVLLVFSESSLDEWKMNDRRNDVDPLDDRRNHLSDAIAIPGLNHLVNAPTDRMSMGNDNEDTGINGPPTIEIDRTEVRLGSNDATELIAFKSAVQAIIDAITNSATVATDGGAAYKANMVAALVGVPVGSLKVKSV